MKSLRPIIAALEEAHRHFNRELFSAHLSGDLLLTIQTKGRRRAYGWYGHGFWEGQEGERPPAEMNLSAEDLRREPVDVMTTLVHEMVHQRAAETGIKDTSRNGRYHNKEFARLAAMAGMLAPDEADKRHGFAHVSLGPSDFRARRAFDSISSTVLDTLTLARKVFPPKTSTSRQRLFICQCERPYKIRTGRADLLAQCCYCDERFEEVKK